jgi:hypothetical protein
MLHEQTIAHIKDLSDAELVEYVLTGTRVYEPEAIAFAQAELDRRKLPPEQLATLRQPVIAALSQYDAHASIDAKPHSGSAILCQGCGFEVPNRYVEYHQNIGAMVVRFTQRYKGYLCKRCNRKFFWQATLITLFAGWWGLISFFITPVFLLGNLLTYLRTTSLPPVPPDAGPPRYDDAVLARIAPHVQVITERLGAGDDMADVARATAPVAGVTPGQVWYFMRDVLRQSRTDKVEVGPVR